MIKIPYETEGQHSFRAEGKDKFNIFDTVREILRILI
jgi:hypothetical protein